MKIYHESDSQALSVTLKSIKDGEPVIIPTETVYGLICDAGNDEAIQKLRTIKGRDHDKPFSIFLPDLKLLSGIVDANQYQTLIKIADRFWPGPLTIIVKVSPLEAVDANISASCLSYQGDDAYLGIRIPDYKFCLEVLKACGRPLIATSVNLSGQPDARLFAEITPAIIEKVGVAVEGETLECSQFGSSTIIKLLDIDSSGKQVNPSSKVSDDKTTAATSSPPSSPSASPYFTLVREGAVKSEDIRRELHNV